MYVERTINQNLYGLSFDQQEWLEKHVDEMSLSKLAKGVFDDNDLDERSSEYYGVKKFVSKLKREPRIVHFTEEQLDFIEGNAGEMGPFEMAKTLFPDKADLKPLSKETQTIKQYIDALGDIATEKEGGYRPPKSFHTIVRKINVADPNAVFVSNDLSPWQRECVEALKSYFQSIRFLSFMKMIEEEDLRRMFEEEFVKAIYDKPDLNSEELNMYIQLCFEYVNIHRLEKQKTMLSRKIDETVNEEDQKLFYTWVEMYDKREKDLSQTKTRVEKLQTNLSSTRARRLEKQAQVNESLTKFVEEWKSEEGRKRALVIAEAKRLELEGEVNRVEDFDEYIANVMGIGKDEILSY